MNAPQKLSPEAAAQAREVRAGIEGNRLAHAFLHGRTKDPVTRRRFERLAAAGGSMCLAAFETRLREAQA